MSYVYNILTFIWSVSKPTLEIQQVVVLEQLLTFYTKHNKMLLVFDKYQYIFL